MSAPEPVVRRLAASPPSWLRVLIIDDCIEPGNAAIGLLRLGGIDPTVAQAAADGIRLALTGVFGLILPDLNLPDL